MKNQMNQQQPTETRRAFLKATGTAVAGLCLTGQATEGASQGVPAGKESLAQFGGTKAVTHPHDNTTRWPLYGADEEKEIVKLLRDPNYTPIDQLEKDWKERFQVPHVRACCSLSMPRPWPWRTRLANGWCSSPPT